MVGKMLHYRISESLVKRVVRFPKRVEKGIAPGTTACMSPYGRSPKGRQQPYGGEVWVMYVELGQRPSSTARLQTKKELQTINDKLSTTRKRIITAWRYPGVSPVGESIPIPEEILAEINRSR